MKPDYPNLVSVRNFAFTMITTTAIPRSLMAVAALVITTISSLAAGHSAEAWAKDMLARRASVQWK